MSRLKLLSTPSDGVDEVIRALFAAHAYGDRYVTPQRLKRHFVTRTTVTDIETALASAEDADYVQDNGTAFQLTADGFTRARSHVRGGYSNVT